MARPQKGSEARRDIIVRARFTAAEKNTLHDLAAKAGYTPSDFIRVKTIGSKPHIRKATPERAALIHLQAELNRVGNNVNQIARALNRRSDADTLTGFSMEWVKGALNDIQTLTALIAKELGHDGHSG